MTDIIRLRDIIIPTLAIIACQMILSSASCRKEPGGDPHVVVPDKDKAAKEFLRDEYISVYYYWNAQVRDRNKSILTNEYDIYQYFDALLYAQDRWSWMTDREYYVSSETGVVSGTYGASLSQPIEYYGDYSVRVRYVFPDSPFYLAGVRRGWALTHIGGVEVMTLIRYDRFNDAYGTSPQTFTFSDLEGVSHTFDLTAATSLNTHSSLMVKTFGPEDFPGLNEKVGYFNYLAFKANFLSDITESMEYLASQDVHTLILDLRYNGGGDSRASQLLVDCLAPAFADGQVYVRRVHNEELSSHNMEARVGESEPSLVRRLDLQRLYVIVGAGSASASEMVINGLRPMMDVRMVGDTTYGKPNGMYVLMYPGTNADYAQYNKGNYDNLEWVFLPICFYNQNGIGEKIPDTGFIPDNYRPDDLYHDFDASEDNIRACLTHIVTGLYPELPRLASGGTKAAGGRRIALSEEDRNPRYGLYTVRKEAP